MIIILFAGENQRGINDFSETWGTKRLLAEEQNDVNSSLVLAEERTARKDPLNGLKKYRGGWNISEKHYWGVSFIYLFTILCIQRAFFDLI